MSNPAREAIMAQLRSSGFARTAGRTPFDRTDAKPRGPERPTFVPDANHIRWEDALRRRGLEGVRRLKEDPQLDLDAPFQQRPTTKFGGLVSRLIERRATMAGLSVGALAAAAGGGTQAASAGVGGWSASTAGAAAGVGGSVYGGQVPSTYDRTLVMLVNRLTGSFDEAEYSIAASLGFNGYLDYHLNHGAIADPDVQAFMNGDPTVTPTGDPTTGFLANCADDSAFDLALTPGSTGLLWSDLLQAQTLYRTVLTKRRFHDRMTEFWTDHFNIDVRLEGEGFLKPVDDREVIRQHALGDFPSMLTASAHSPAMLVYLNQFTSTYPAPNENYARELLELHTVGEGNGYTEVDVEEVAQILAGWSLSGLGLYQYNPALHNPNSPAFSILKNDPAPIAIPAGGEIQGDALIAGLAGHRLTASFIAYKLCRFLYSDNPPPELVADVRNAYMDTTGGQVLGDIQRMIRVILTPSNLEALLLASPSTKKFKRPMQLAATFLRQLGGGPVWPAVLANPLGALRDKLHSMGNAPFWWGPPNGYPDAEGAWVNDMLGRWELVDAITRNEIEHIVIDPNDLTTILGGYPVAGIGFRMNEALAGGQLTSEEQFWIQEYADIGAILLALGEVTMNELVGEIFAVTASAPNYQYY